MTQTLEIRESKGEPAVAPAPLRENSPPSGLETSIYRFIIRHSLKKQILVLIITLLSFPFLYYSLELPKTIVNRAIGGKKFPQEYLGIELDQIPYLMTLCGVFLLLVFVNGGFKYYINVLKGQIGERMLRRLRYELYHRLLRFPTGHFKKISSAEMIPMITAEVEPLGGFMGDSIALPVFQGGTLLTLIVFMFVQDPILGAAAVALYPLQGYLIPKLQRKVNQLGKQRVRTMRVVADRIGESAAGIAEIHTNDNVRLHLASFTRYLGTIYDIRFEIFQRKFFVKFLNNFIAQLTPFFFYTIGGYLVIQGSLSFGALVAVLAAYKDLASPWKELLDFYQQKEDARIKYEQVVEQFEPEGMMDPRLQLDEPAEIPPLTGDLAVANLSLVEDERARIIDGVTFSLPIGRHVALLGHGGSGKQELAMVLARLVAPSSGRVTIGGVDMATLPGAVTGRRIAYASSTPHLFSGSLRENFVLGLKHRPTRERELEGPDEKRHRTFISEARLAGNIDFDIEADWIDYDAAGVNDEAELTRRTVDVIRMVDLDEDVYGFGLRGRINPKRQPALADQLLAARTALSHRLAQDGIVHLVEPFDATRYNSNATMAENLLFGTPVGPDFDADTLAKNAYVLQVLDKVGLRGALVEMGEQVAATMVELFADLPPDHEFFEQFSFINANDLPEFQAILGRIAKGGRDGLKEEDRISLLSLPFKLIVNRHRLGLVDEAMQTRLLEARRVFAADLPEDRRSKIEFFDAERYNAAATLQDNILFGKIAYGEAEAAKRIPVLIAELVTQLGLRDTVITVGLDFQVGSGGSRLSLAQRQKVAIARALLKRPDLFVLNEAFSALDGHSQVKVLAAVRAEMAGRGLIAVLQRASLSRSFDTILVMSAGRLVEQGSFAELDQPDTMLTKLVQAE